jgi:hypothetical protein
VLVWSNLRDHLPPELYDEPFPGERRFVGHNWGAHLLRGKVPPVPKSGGP